MDNIQLYAEKVRRTVLRVKIRSNFHIKKLGFKMMKKYIREKEIKRYNNERANELRKKFDTKK